VSDRNIGIGLMMAKALEENGAKVYMIGRRLEVLEKAAQQGVCNPQIPFSSHELIWNSKIWQNYPTSRGCD
jgi:hypothetical protein